MDALLIAVLNALWQGAALIGVAALALRLGLRRNATTACVIWSVAFTVVALLPLIDLALARPWVSAQSRAVSEVSVRIAPASAAPGVPAPQIDDVSYLTARISEAPAAAPGPTAPERVRDAALALGGAASVFARTWGIFVLCAWVVVAGALLLRLARGYGAIARMKRDAVPLADPVVLARLRAAGHRRHADVACSTQVGIPCAVGFRRPMILLPAGLAASLDADDLARVILHESAHLQRYDDWTNALEQVVCALQFFQPALYVARRGIDFEREVACDDRVLEDAGEPLRYAECLARIVQRHVRGRQAAVVPGFVLRKAQVVARVRCIVDRSRDASPHLRVAAFALTGALFAATLGMTRLQVPMVAPALAAPIEGDCVCPPVAHRAKLRPAHAARPAQTRTAKRAVAPVKVAEVRKVANVTEGAKATPVAKAVKAAKAAKAVKAAAVLPAASSRIAWAPAAASAAQLADDAKLVRSAVVAPVADSEELARTAAALAEVAALREAPVAQRRFLTTVSVSAPLAAAHAALEGAATTFHVVPHAVRILSSSRGSDLLEAIDEAKYPHPSVDELIALRNGGVTGDYIRRMGALGRNRPSLHQLLALAMQGVSPEYVGVLDRRLASPPSMDDVIALRVQGVSASWLDGLAMVGYQRLTPAEAASLAVQGVTVVYVHGLLDAGLRNVSPAQLAALRTQGVDGTFVRRLTQRGYRNLSVDELVRLKVSGLEP